MSLSALTARLARIKKNLKQVQQRSQQAQQQVQQALKNPTIPMTLAGLVPDQWQQTFLQQAHHRTLLLAARQSGKSQVVASLALYTALTVPKSFILLLSPTLRQSGELFREKLLPLWLAIGQPLKLRNPTQLEIKFSNGSRIVSLPESEATIRGFSGVTLLVIDEAARVNDLLYKAVRPMLAMKGGSLVAMTTPFGCRGWFYEAWVSTQKWDRIKVTATECPRLTPEFLAEELQVQGEVWYKQEYEVMFGVLVGALWPAERFPDEPNNSIYFDDYPERSIGCYPVHKVMACDTSRGESELHDWQSFTLVTLYNDASFWIEAYLCRVDDLALFNKAEELIAKWQPKATVVETAHSGYVLFQQLRRAGHKVLGRKRPGHTRKYDRISTRLTPLWNERKIHIRRSEGGRELVDQARQWPIKDAHDDALDSLEAGVELCGQLILPIGHPMRVVKYET